jgi:Domain of unknown function (DUF4868)
MPIGNFRNVQFGLCYAIDGQEIPSLIPVDQEIQIALIAMRETFYNEFLSIEGEPRNFEPSEKYGTSEKLIINLSYQGLDKLRDLYTNSTLTPNSVDITNNTENILFYFALFYDQNGAKTIGVKRPSQFKGLLKSRNKLVRLVDDTLQMVDDNILKLDHDFDFVIHETFIDILHPTGFHFISDIDAQVLASAQQATIALGTRIDFINFSNLAPFVGQSKRAAKLIASIRSRNDLESTSRDKLIMKCSELGVVIREDGNMICPEDTYIIDFLNILDRRGYDYDLTHEGKEYYLANNRVRVQ